MHDELVQEAAGFALVVTLRLSLLDLSRQMAGCLVVHIVLIFVFIEICFWMLVRQACSSFVWKGLRFLSFIESFLLIFSLTFCIDDILTWPKLGS